MGTVTLSTAKVAQIIHSRKEQLANVHLTSKVLNSLALESQGQQFILREETIDSLIKSWKIGHQVMIGKSNEHVALVSRLDDIRRIKQITQKMS